MTGGAPMLATMLVLALFAQDPGAQNPGWASSGGGEPAATDALEFRGEIELSRGEAQASALRVARAEVYRRLVERSASIAASAAPFWLPAFVTDHTVREWVDGVDSDVRVLSRHTEARKYSYGTAYQTRIAVADASLPDRAGAERALRRQVHRAGRLFLARCGGIAAFWGLLAFLCGWVDRLSRGYMTWRLRFLFLALGLTAAPLALFL